MSRNALHILWMRLNKIPLHSPVHKPVAGKRSLLARISGNVLWAMVAEFLSKGVLFLLTVHLASILGAASFGTFSFVLTVFTFLWMGVDLGLGMYGSREVARNPTSGDGLVSTLSSMRAVLALLVGLAALLIIGLVARSTIPAPLVWCFCGYLFVRALYADWFLMGKEQYRLLAIIAFFVALAMIAAMLIMVTSADDLKWAATPWLAGYAVGAVVIWTAIFTRHRDQVTAPTNTGEWLKHWGESVHFTLSNGVSTVYQNLPLLSLYFLGDATATGEFAAPFRVILAGIFVSSILPMAMYPVLADLYQRRARNLGRIILLASLFIACAAICVALLIAWQAPFIIDRLFGSDYENSVMVLRILLVFFVIRSVRAVYVRFVCAAGYQRDYAKIASIALLVLALLLVFVKVLGAPVLLATCWVLAIVEFYVLFALWKFSQGILGSRLEKVDE